MVAWWRKPLRARTDARRGAGFTLVELAVAVVIIGVLAAFAVPKYVATVERSKASEAFEFLKSVHKAQERYQARMGTYTTTLERLDVSLDPTTYFSIGAIEVPAGGGSIETSWQLILTREGPSGGYGAYTVIYNQDGFDGDLSTIDPAISPMQGATGGGGAAPSTGNSNDDGGAVACAPT